MSGSERPEWPIGGYITAPTCNEYGSPYVVRLEDGFHIGTQGCCGDDVTAPVSDDFARAWLREFGAKEEG